MKYELKRIRSHFTRYGIEAVVYDDAGNVARRRVRVVNDPVGFICDESRLRFYGNDGRRVRAQAVQWAKDQIA
jgi:hypothetical protein